ncbi:hypothetical protein D3C72_1919290 [compost metagenome]
MLLRPPPATIIIDVLLVSKVDNSPDCVAICVAPPPVALLSFPSLQELIDPPPLYPPTAADFDIPPVPAPPT